MQFAARGIARWSDVIRYGRAACLVCDYNGGGYVWDRGGLTGSMLYSRRAV